MVIGQQFGDEETFFFCRRPAAGDPLDGGVGGGGGRKLLKSQAGEWEEKVGGGRRSKSGWEGGHSQKKSRRKASIAVESSLRRQVLFSLHPCSPSSWRSKSCWPVCRGGDVEDCGSAGSPRNSPSPLSNNFHQVRHRS